MHSIIDAAIGRARTVLLVFLLILIAGMVGYGGIPKESEPDIQIPFMYVLMHVEGISPEDAERLLVRPMETKLATVEGVKEMTAQAYEGGASVTLEFFAGFDSDQALMDVREQVDEARPELPTDLKDEPSVHEINFSLFPVLNVILRGSLGERQLLRVARDLRDKVESQENVLSATIAGAREEALEVIIDPLLLESYGLTLEETLGLFRRNNVLVPAGSIDTGQGAVSIKVPGLLEDVQDFVNLPVKVRGNAVVRLRDVAIIRRGFKDPTGFARVNGQPALVLEVVKRSGENLIETVEGVRELVDKEKSFWPPGIEVIYAQDTSDNIKDMLTSLQNNIILAVLLVMVVIIVVMGVRASLLVAIAIPGAFLVSILTLWMMGVTLNIVVLFSLILSIGMLVDAAIVVVEYAERKRDEGHAPRAAFGLAAKRMAWPVISSNITTLMVFLPLLFWPGIVGEFMKFMPLTLMVTLAASLLMALIFLPTIGAWLDELMLRWRGEARGSLSPISSLGERAGGEGATSRDAGVNTALTLPLSRGEREAVALPPQIKGNIVADTEDIDSWDGDISRLHPFAQRYARLLSKTLEAPGKAAGMVMGVLVIIIAAYALLGKGVEFFPDIEPDNLSVQVRARGNLSVWEKDAIMRQVETRLMSLEDGLILYARTGIGRQQKMPEDVIGVLQVELKNWRWRRKVDEIIRDIETRMIDMAGVIIEVRKQEGGPRQGKPIEVEFRSRTPDALPGAVATFRRAMDEAQGLRDVEDSRPIPAIEWNMDIDRELASKFGADVQVAGSFMKMVTNGLIVDTYRPDDADDELDVVVRFPPANRTVSQLDRLRVATPEGRVPMSNFVTRTAAPTISTIDRVDQMRVLTVKADVAPDVLPNDLVKQLQEWMTAHPEELNPEVQMRFKGEDEDQREASQFLASAFVLALFGMFLIMVTQFNHVYHTVVVMSAVFFSTAGVLLGLVVTGQPFGIVMCGVGVITLAGVVVNNNIIFIDTYSLLLKRGVPVKEALLQTGIQRLRPILLTAATTILGLIPMVIGLNINFVSREVSMGAPSSQWWTQLSTAIAGGLTFATVLTLFFTPALLMIGQRVHKRVENTRVGRRLFGGAPAKVQRHTKAT